MLSEGSPYSCLPLQEKPWVLISPGVCTLHLSGEQAAMFISTATSVTVCYGGSSPLTLPDGQLGPSRAHIP